MRIAQHESPEETENKGNSTLLSLFAPVSLLLLLFWGAQPAHCGELVFIGRGDKNIHVAQFDTNSGALTDLREVAQLSAPSFLAIAPNHKFLFAVSEGQEPDTSALTAFAIKPGGGLRMLNHQLTGGLGPCQVSVDAQTKCAMVANYASGSIALFPVENNGWLGPLWTFYQYHGSSVNPERQAGPHAHAILADPADRFAFACDLGLDKVFIYKIDPEARTLQANDPSSFETKPGAGPRHLAFHPNGRFAYLINEIDCTIDSLAYDAGKGALTEIQTVRLLPDDFKGWNTAAEVAVHPSGKWVYGSNRGDNSLVVFACAPETGKLTFVERRPSGGKTPRSFEIDATGNFLLAANQDSGAVVVFRIDPATGKLQETGQRASLPMPMCVKCMVE